jgi:O-antigen/teichoic acid export membrane protein
MGLMKSLKVNSLLNAIKSMMRIAFPLITLPYVSRVLQVENLGKYNFSLTVVTYFSYIASLGINGYGIRNGSAIRNDKQQFEKFACEIFTINIVSMTIAYLLLIIVTLNSEKIVLYRSTIFILALNIFFTAIGTEWLFSIFEDYLYITVRSVIFQIVSVILMFILVKTPGDLNSYALLTVISGGGSNILNWFHARKYCKIKLTRRPQFKKHLGSVLSIFASDLAILVYVNSDVIMLGYLSSDYYVGLYGFSCKIYAGLKTLLGALIIVSIPRLSFLWGTDKREQYYATLYKIFETSITVMLPLAAGVIMTSREIVLLLGGTPYLESSVSLSLLSAATVFCELSYIYTQCILMPMHKENILMLITFFSAAANIGLNFVFIPLLKQNGAAVTTILAEFLVYILARYATRRDVNFRTCYGTLAKSLAGCMAITFICSIIFRLVGTGWRALLFCVVFSVIGYAAVEILLKNKIVTEMLLKIHCRHNG